MTKSTREPTAQWTLDVTVYHSAELGHLIKAQVLGRAGGWYSVGQWSWKGLGVPAPLVDDITARICAVLTEHLTSRYGIQETLRYGFEGGQGPF